MYDLSMSNLKSPHDGMFMSRNYNSKNKKELIRKGIINNVKCAAFVIFISIWFSNQHRNACLDMFRQHFLDN